jgi:hypothetical protein
MQEKINELDKKTRADFARIDARIDELGIHSETLDSTMRKLGVMYENVDTKFRLLMEGFGGLDKRLSDINERLAKGIQPRGAFGI